MIPLPAKERRNYNTELSNRYYNPYVTLNAVSDIRKF
jgi:hypothetical protein